MFVLTLTVASGAPQTFNSQLGHILLQYEDWFSKSKTDLGHCHTLPFKIELKPGTAPIASRDFEDFRLLSSSRVATDPPIVSPVRPIPLSERISQRTRSRTTPSTSEAVSTLYMHTVVS